MAASKTRVYTAAAAILAVAAIGSLNIPSRAGAATPGGARWYDSCRHRSSIVVTGVMWEFYKSNAREANPAFGTLDPKHGNGQYMDILKPTLDDDGKPVFSSAGFLIQTPWTDSHGRGIIWPKSYIADLPGDVAGSSPKKVAQDAGDAVTIEEDVYYWFRDCANANESYQAPITFNRVTSGTGILGLMPHGEAYVFDSFIPRGGQRTLGLAKGADDILSMIAAGKAKKKRYSWECDTTFVYEKGAQWWFTIKAQNDVWVYIDNKLVIDIGGAFKSGEKRSSATQTIALDRLGWLTDGGTYSLRIFMVDRDKNSDKSPLMIQTTIETLNLVGPATAASSAQHD
jgi:fibro-slime domain-containing protein